MTDAVLSRGMTVRSVWLWLSAPIAILAMAGSIAGIMAEDRIYGQETANWAAQSVGQDIANLIVFPAVLVFAGLALRGSLRAYLVWTGLLAYSVYTYAIYVFDVHFGSLFLVWVAVFGLSIFALVGGLASMCPRRVRSAFTGRPPIWIAATLLIAIAVAFALLWLAEVVPAMLDGTAPAGVVEAGLRTNPVHVVDLAVFLPSAALAGVLLVRRHAWGYLLAPVMLVAMVALAFGIVSLMIVIAARGLEATPAVGIAIAVLAVAELVVVVRLLAAIGDDNVQRVLRPVGSRCQRLAVGC